MRRMTRFMVAVLLAGCASEVPEGGSSSDFQTCDDSDPCVVGQCVAGECRTDFARSDGGPSGSGGSSGSIAMAGGSGGISAGGSGGTPSGGSPSGGQDAGPGVTGPICDADDGTQWDLAWKTLECEVVFAINAQRAQGASCPAGLTFPSAGPLSKDLVLTANAREHAMDMADNDYVDLVDSLGRDVFVWASQGYPMGIGGAAILSGPPSAQEVVTMLMGSLDNCQNVMGEYSAIGVGYHPNPVDAGAPDAGPGTFSDYWTIIYAR